MTRLDEIKERLANITGYPWIKSDVASCDISGDVEWEDEETGLRHDVCFVYDREPDALFIMNAPEDTQWLIEQLEERNKQLLEVMKTADDGLDKITKIVEGLGVISPEKLRELWGLRILKKGQTDD